MLFFLPQKTEGLSVSGYVLFVLLSEHAFLAYLNNVPLDESESFMPDCFSFFGNSAKSDYIS